MTLSFYQSMITVPNELNEATHVYQLSPWQRFWRLEVPFAMPGLLWNAMMSMSGGWFFVVAAEAISVANQSITLPGVGSYIAMAITHKDVHAIVYAIIAMLIVILLYDQLFFRPLLKWAEKFKLTDIPDEHSNSWVLTILKRTRVLQRVGRAYSNMMNAFINVSLFKTQGKPMARPKTTSRTRRVIANSAWYAIVLLIIIASLGFMAHFIFKTIPFRSTLHVIELGAFTCTRVFVLILLCSILWVPVGVWMGMRPKAAQFFQPIAQFLAAFPANLLFPIVVIAILKYHLNIEIWTAPLMILGTQWYILFNVIAGASTIPKELKLAAQNMQLSGWVKWKRFLFPAIFPYYITGAITAAGGAWNASVVAEVIHWGHTTLKAQGLGAYIAENTTSGHFPQVALGIVVMCLFVVIINIVFWRKLYHYANTRFAMN
jgi:NitT/TauT family transport system permease protein